MASKMLIFKQIFRALFDSQIHKLMRSIVTCIFGSSDVLSPNSNKSHVNEIPWLSGILKHVSCFLDENPHLKYVSTRSSGVKPRTF